MIFKETLFKNLKKLIYNNCTIEEKWDDHAW